MKKLILLCLIVCASKASFAQGNEFIVSWQIAEPGEEIKNMITKTSFQGWSFAYRRGLGDRFSVGANLGWNIFHHEIDRSTWDFPNISVTSKNWRFTHAVPISATFHFNPYRNTGNDWQWFMGLGTGASYINQEIWAGMYSFRAENWNYHVYPELGLRYVLSDQTALLFSAQYMYMPGGSYTGKDLTYLNFRIGLSFGRHRIEE